MPRFISYRELRNTPGAVRQALEEDGAVALTANGQPMAIMFAVEEGEVVEALEVLRRVRGQMALTKLRRATAEGGLDMLKGEEIDAEIGAARAERKRRSGRARRKVTGA